MPTICSTSADRPAISGFRLIPWVRSTSLNCAPIDLTGFSAFIALCMTTDRFFQRTAASWESVRPTMLVPWKTTLPPVISAGGASSWAMANSSVDLPQPDSPTIPMNSPRRRSKLTSCTATTLPRGVAYATDRSATSSTVSAPPVLVSPVSAAPGWAARAGRAARLPLALAGALDTDPPGPGQAAHRPQGRVADLVEGVVQQGESRPEQGDAGAGHDRPQVLAGLQRGAILRPVQHRAPAQRVRVAEADELQPGRGQHVVDGGAEEGG